MAAAIIMFLYVHRSQIHKRQSQSRIELAGLCEFRDGRIQLAALFGRHAGVQVLDRGGGGALQREADGQHGEEFTISPARGLRGIDWFSRRRESGECRKASEFRFWLIPRRRGRNAGAYR